MEKSLNSLPAQKKLEELINEKILLIFDEEKWL
jgi:hypothetical protein